MMTGLTTLSYARCSGIPNSGQTVNALWILGRVTDKPMWLTKTRLYSILYISHCIGSNVAHCSREHVSVYLTQSVLVATLLMVKRECTGIGEQQFISYCLHPIRMADIQKASFELDIWKSTQCAGVKENTGIHAV